MQKINPKIIIIMVVIIVILILVFSTAYQVDKDEIAVVTRFGKYVRSEEPGFRLRLPFGVENIVKIPVKKVLKEEFGFVTKIANTGRSEFERGNEQLDEARMLTADLKVIQIEWIVQYKITDPVKYVFNVRGPRESLRTFSVIAMSQIAGDYLFDEIITIAKTDITTKVRDLIQAIIDKMEMGISVQTVELINVTPPKDVETAYNEVLQAQQEKDKIINEAKQQYNKEVIPVKGEAERMIAVAEGYKAQRVKVAQGEAKYFNALYTEYIRAPEVTKKRMYLETMSEILPKLNNVYVIDEQQKNLVPLMQMGIKDLTNKGE